MTQRQWITQLYGKDATMGAKFKDDSMDNFHKRIDTQMAFSFQIFPPPRLVSTSLLFRELEEDNRCSIWLTFDEFLTIFLTNLPKEEFGSQKGLSM